MVKLKGNHDISSQRGHHGEAGEHAPLVGPDVNEQHEDLVEEEHEDVAQQEDELELLILGLDSAATSRTTAAVRPPPLPPSPVGVVNRAERCTQHRRSQRWKSLRERSSHAPSPSPARVAHAPSSG
ncbi:hypothetical protein LR48_Vigan04g216100 [Vigna angularis]|uniref:Uncharacterized protein n=1 Tax=Phaseolus angularis TaxID=3914 RepID=A0A0L9UGV9_PHAAN|nr:hypothetical protein LR48_Vigan04g216100 [Vigna angularis]